MVSAKLDGVPCTSSRVTFKIEKNIPYIEGLVHKINIDKDIKPVQQQLRRLPLAVRDEIKTELEHILRNGAIEKNESPTWISSVVVARKESGKIRLYVDLRQPKIYICNNR